MKPEIIHQAYIDALEKVDSITRKGNRISARKISNQQATQILREMRNDLIKLSDITREDYSILVKSSRMAPDYLNKK